MAIQGPRYSMAINGLWKKIQGGFQRTAGANLLGIQLINNGVPQSRLFTAPDRGGNAQSGPWALYAADNATLKKAQSVMNQGGGSGTGSGTGFGGAANAFTPQHTGGGRGLDLGATGITGLAVAVKGEFLGLNFKATSTKLGEGESPDAVNVDGIGSAGGLSPRPGLVALYPKRNDDVSTASTVPTDYRGRSINFLGANFQQSGINTAVLAYDSSTIGTSGTSAVLSYAKPVRPLWNPQHDIRFVKPEVAVTDSTASGGVGLSIQMPTRYQKATNSRASVDQLIVRASTQTYPRDRDGEDGTNSRVVSDYVSFDGTSTAVSDSHSSVSSGTTVFYSAWGLSKSHESQRAKFALEVQ